MSKFIGYISKIIDENSVSIPIAELTISYHGYLNFYDNGDDLKTEATKNLIIAIDKLINNENYQITTDDLIQAIIFLPPEITVSIIKKSSKEMVNGNESAYKEIYHTPVYNSLVSDGLRQVNLPVFNALIEQGYDVNAHIYDDKEKEISPNLFEYLINLHESSHDKNLLEAVMTVLISKDFVIDGININQPIYQINDEGKRVKISDNLFNYYTETYGQKYLTKWKENQNIKEGIKDLENQVGYINEKIKFLDQKIKEELVEQIKKSYQDKLFKLQNEKGKFTQEIEGKEKELTQNNIELTKAKADYQTYAKAQMKLMFCDGFKYDKATMGKTFKLIKNYILENALEEFAKSTSENINVNYMKTLLALHQFDVKTGAKLKEDFKSKLEQEKNENYTNCINQCGFLYKALLINKDVTKLDLSRNDIGIEGAKAIAEALKENKTITELNLWGNKIGDDVAIALAEALKVNNTITTLNFAYNNIGKDGAIALADALKVNNTITELCLFRNNIKDDGAKALADMLEKNNTITELDLSCNNIEIDGAKAIAVMLEKNETITVLYLFRNNIGDAGAKALAAMLEKNKTITKLNLSSNNIKDDGAKALAAMLEKNKTITKLNLSSNNIGIEGVIELGRACAGKKIEVEFNDDEKNNLFKLAQVTFTKTTLNFSKNNIGIDGAKALAAMLEKNETITELDLSQNNIGIEGAIALAGMLEKNKTITKLDLSSNNIGIEGAKALADALKVNKTITELDLSSNNIGIEGAKALADALKVNKTITTLNLAWNKIGIEGAKALAEALEKNKTITKLDLNGHNIGDDGAKALAAMLEKNKTITILNLSSNGIGIEGVIALGRACAGKNIAIEFGNDKKNDLFKLAQGTFTGTTLNFAYNNIGDAGAKALAGMLEKNETITELDLSSNNIGIEGAIALGRACAGKNIKVEFGNNGVNNLFELAQETFTGTTFNLWGNEIGGAGAKSLADMLKVNKTITKLDLSGNNIGDDGVIAIAEALKENNTITTLNLLYNNIGKDGAIAIAGMLKMNNTITVLYLSGNNIRKEGAIAIAKALKENKAITKLYLGGNAITDNVIIALGRACAGKDITVDFGDTQKNDLFKLAQGTFERKKLYLQYNNIGDAGAKALAEALKVNNTITTLNLSYNNIGIEGAKALGRACAGKDITVDFGNTQKNDLFKLAQKYGNKKVESSYFFNIPAAATGIFTASTIITLATIITLSILASQGIIGFDSAAFIAPIASVGAINLVTFIGFAITEVKSKIMDYKNVSEYNQVHKNDGLAKKQTLLQVLNPCHKVQFVDKELSKEINNEETPLIEK
jgi:Ran GTPase-activating protein (RanGAP) involved in mRNA processing and transport